MITSNDEELLHRAFLMTNCGRDQNDTAYQHIMVSTNARLSEFQGAVLRAQLTRLNEQLKKREDNYQYLKIILEEVDGIVLQTAGDGVTLSSHYMVMLYYEESYFKGTREEFVQYLGLKGIPCNRTYEAMHRLPVFQKLHKEAYRVAPGIKEGENGCLNSEKIANQGVCLNHNILLGDQILVKEIAEVIKTYIRY